ncbi:hypothetical protein AVEN_235877-1, partial [Araneus ventricosus]
MRLKAEDLAAIGYLLTRSKTCFAHVAMRFYEALDEKLQIVIEPPK